MEPHLGNNSNGNAETHTISNAEWEQAEEPKTRVIADSCPHCKGEKQLGCRNKIINVKVVKGEEHRGAGSYVVCPQFKEYDLSHPQFMEPVGAPCPYGKGCQECDGEGRVSVSHVGPPRPITRRF